MAETRASHSAGPRLGVDMEHLEKVFRQQDEQQAVLLGLLVRKREAIAKPHAQTIEELCRRESEVLQRIDQLEQSRQRIVKSITQHIDESRTSPMTLAEIADVAGGESGARLLVIAAQMKEKIHQSQRLSAVLKSASEALSHHLAGVLQTFQTALGQARVYGRSGRLVSGARVRSTLDMVS